MTKTNSLYIIDVSFNLCKQLGFLVDSWEPPTPHEVHEFQPPLRHINMDAKCMLKLSISLFLLKPKFKRIITVGQERELVFALIYF